MVKPGSFESLTIDSMKSDGDGQSKLDHVAAMLGEVVYSKQLTLATVLMGCFFGQSICPKITAIAGMPRKS